ncbi:MAG: ABC transporter ATP-binding protein [Candidatus Methanomethylophilaceae archaeon]|nr:ABC transporter ATP-binding protein [Candidatus Methanomethylophilaceae archaeon]
MTRDPIELEGLRKEYGSFTAVDGLDLKIKRNSFTGFLGPNGAGKSTTLKILTNLINATSGSAYLNGVDVVSDPSGALVDVGAVVETPEFYPYLTPRETMRYIGGIIGMSREAVASETEEILEKVKMTEWGDKKLGTFSKGMRQRIALGQALLDDPKVIILDEPTSGLDPRGMAEMREILKNLRNDTNDLTILMSSHILHEVSDLCDRVAMINHGRLLVHDGIDVVKSIADYRGIVVRTMEEPTPELLSRIRGMDNVVDAQRNGGNECIVKIKGGAEEQRTLYTQMAESGIGVYSLSEVENSLETIYLDLIKETR